MTETPTKHHQDGHRENYIKVGKARFAQWKQEQKTSITDLQARIAQLQNEVDRYRADISEAQAAQIALEEHNNVMQEQLQQYQQEKQEVEDKSERARSELEAQLRMKNEELAKNVAVSTDTAFLHSQVKELQEACTKANEALANKQAEYDAILSQNAQLLQQTQQQAASQSPCSSLNNSGVMGVDPAAHQEAVNKAYEQGAAQVAEQAKQLEKRLQDAESHNTTTQKTIQDYEATINQYATRINELTNQLSAEQQKTQQALANATQAAAPSTATSSPDATSSLVPHLTPHQPVSDSSQTTELQQALNKIRTLEKHLADTKHQLATQTKQVAKVQSHTKPKVMGKISKLRKPGPTEEISEREQKFATLGDENGPIEVEDNPDNNTLFSVLLIQNVLSFFTGKPWDTTNQNNRGASMEL
eukprot:TRINITY_DN64014_c0_g2_i1.p1 TRINITY_DN64014_c0_g2~~TRINITY_DN64014_c0_g2_i1.p1  ORF type:complete len:417 (+),score=68.98 TRINITY_DN64014_c0_g2_i1:27-1277(+)